MIVDKVDCKTCTRTNCMIQKHCSNEWKTLITEEKQDFIYGAEQSIFLEGQKVQGIYIIYEGKVKIINTQGNKQESIIRLATDGEILGHRGYGGPDNIYPISAVALEETHVGFIPNEVFIRALKENPEFCFSLLMFYAEELKKSEVRTAKQIYMPTLNRIACSLQMTANTFGYRPGKEKLLAFTPSRTDIAKMTNTTYASLIRGLKELEAQKIVTLVKKQIAISDEEKLKKLTEF